METRNEAPATMAVSPGNILREELRERRISQKELAERIGIQPSHLSEIIRGKRDISRRVADKLEHELGIPSIDWMRMQLAYDYDMVGVPRERGIIESVHPGKVLKAEMKRRDVSPDQLSAEIGVPLFLLNDLLEEKTKLETEMAMMLEAAIGLKASWLLSLQNEYDMLMAGRNAPFMEKLKKIRQIAAALSLVVFLFVSCTSRQTASALNDVETYIQERPDSALATIRSIDTTTLTTRKLRAHYALLHAMALDKNWIDTTDVNVVMPAVEYYDKHPSGIHQVKAWYYLGRIQQNGNNRTDASISFLKAERYSEAYDDVKFKGLICLAMSDVYSQTHLHEEALNYSTRAYSLFVEAKDTNNANSALFCMAKDYNNLGRYNEADSLYQSLLQSNHLYPNLRDDLLCSYALSCVTNKMDFEKAIFLFEEAISNYGSLPKLNYWGAYAYTLFRTGNTKRAYQLFNQLEVGTNLFQKYIFNTWKSMADAYAGDYSSAYHLQKAASDIQDENVREVLKQSAVKAQKEFLEEMNRASERLADRRQFIAWVSISLSLGTIFILLLFFRRKKEKSAQEKEELLDAYKNLTMEHSILSTRYSELSTDIDRIENEKASVRNRYIQLCQSHFSKIGRINEVLLRCSEKKDQELYEKLKCAIRDIGMDNKNQSEFEVFLNETFDNVMAHFRADFPKKKSKYYRLVSYFFAGYGSSTICAIIPDYQKYNVHVEKYRLKQMIKDSDSQYQEQYLKMLL